jgi:hypothetical protein
MSVKQILIEANALIDTPEKWTQEAYARDVNRYPISCRVDEAVCFCSLGAINRVTLEKHSHMYLPAVIHLEKTMGMQVADFNDRHSHSEVMAAWDRAIDTAPN